MLEEHETKGYARFNPRNVKFTQCPYHAIQGSLPAISPGNQFVIHADLLSYKRGITKGVAVGKINDAKVCQGEFTFISPHDMPLPQVN